jgi:hypothetical protein
MKLLKEILNEQTQNFKPAKFTQYQVFTHTDGKKKPLGVAWLMEGHKTFTIKLFSFLNEKYFLLPTREDPSKYLFMTREPTKSLKTKGKYHWNVIGNGFANAEEGTVEISFDLLGVKFCMNLYPDESKPKLAGPSPDSFLDIVF